MDIGEKIKAAREDLDLSQSQMARLIPMNQSNYSKIERNLQEPNLAQLKSICKILNIDPRYLLGLNEDDFSTHDKALLWDIKALIKKHSPN
jgi:transcriptional regulator with XRE-family HTH domain